MLATNDELNQLLITANSIMLNFNDMLDINVDTLKNADVSGFVDNIAKLSDIKQDTVVDKILEFNRNVKPDKKTKSTKKSNKSDKDKVIEMPENK